MVTFIKDQGRNEDQEKVFTVQNGVIHIPGTETAALQQMKNMKTTDF